MSSATRSPNDSKPVGGRIYISTGHRVGTGQGIADAYAATCQFDTSLGIDAIIEARVVGIYSSFDVQNLVEANPVSALEISYTCVTFVSHRIPRAWGRLPPSVPTASGYGRRSLSYVAASNLITS
eukprot:852030-Rhodomonas_salina.3